MRRVALVIGALIATGGGIDSAHSQPNKERYELQERCGRLATEVIKREYQSFTDYGRTHIYNYRNHYDPRLNKCFLLLVHLDSPEKKPLGDDTLRELRLIDLNENKEYGWYLGRKDRAPTECSVGEKTCTSE